MGKRSPAPPPAPDYTTLAIKQGEANLAAAKQSAYMSNPNIYSPTGTQTVTWEKTRTTDTDAYNKAMEQWRQASMANPDGYVGEMPTQAQFQTEIEQPTVRQTIDPNAEAALRQQELAQRYMSEAAAGAARGLGGLGIASAFDARSIPGLQYSVPGAGAIATPGSYVPYRGEAGFVDMGFATGDMQLNAPTAGAYVPTATYYTEQLPGQIGAGQQAFGGPAAPGLGQFQYGGPQTAIGETGFAPAGSSFIGIPQQYGVDYSGVGGVGQGTGPFTYGQASGGPASGLFGMAGGGPSGVQFQGLDLSGIGGVQAAPGQGQFGYAQQFVGGPQLQGQIDVSNIAQGPINAGMTAQQAILSRLSPQLQGERQQLQTQLINQGLRPGGEAYNAAMSAQMQKENDLLLQAAAQGISLDQAARQQQFAEQQSRAMFANQAQLQGFGAGMEQAGLYNVGLGQNVQQSLATQAAANQAQQQAFQQRVQSGEFGREAQLASFQTGQQAQELQNQAIAQNFAQGQAAQQMQNQAVQQNLQSALAAEEAQRAAQAQRFGQAQDVTGLQAQLGAQQFGQQAQLQEIINAAGAQNFQQALASREAFNQAQQQAYQQALQGQGFNREALMQQFGMGQQAQELANQAAAQNFAQQQQAAEFNLARQQQQAAQAAGQAGFYNEAQAQAYQRQLAQQAAQNAAQAQRFGQVMDYQGLRNQALAQNQAQDFQRLAAQNAAQQQQFQQNIAGQQFYNTAVQQALAQQAAIRSLPVNEISALLSGGQVSVPQFQGYSGVSVAPAPVFQAGQAAGDFAQRNYANQVGAYNAGMGMLGSLAGAVGTAAGGPLGVAGLFTSDRRLKSNIVRVGTHPLGIGVYEYDIFGERQRGVMADEVENVLPEAVITRPNGYKMVNYGML
jgi:hypothetical protein